jgi:hypothetical protein
LQSKEDAIINQIDYVTRVVVKDDRLLALTTLYHSAQNLPEYYLRCLPPQTTRGFAERIDVKLVEMYSYAAGVDVFDSDNLSYQDNEEWFYVRAGVRPGRGGLGLRYLKDRPSYISAFNSVFTNLSENRNIWPKMSALIGTMNEVEGARWHTLFQNAWNTQVVMGARDQWNQIQDKKQYLCQLIRTMKGIQWQPKAEIMKALVDEDTNMGSCSTKMGKPINDAMQYLAVQYLKAKSETMVEGDMRAASFKASSISSLAQALISFRCPSKIKITDSETAECFANYLGLISPVAKGCEGMKIARSAHGIREVDKFGAQLKATVGCENGGQVTAFHDSINSWIVSHLKQIGISVRGGPGDTCKDLFRHCIGIDGVENGERLTPDTRDRLIQGIIPDLLIDAGSVVEVGSGLDVIRTIMDIKTMAPATTYLASNYRKSGNYAVTMKADLVNKKYQAKARLLDRLYNRTREGVRGPVASELMRYGRAGRVVGLIIGP